MKPWSVWSYDPFCDELWTAIRGEPARLNGGSFGSASTKLGEAIISIGFAKTRENLEATLPYFVRAGASCPQAPDHGFRRASVDVCGCGTIRRLHRAWHHAYGTLPPAAWSSNAPVASSGTRRTRRARLSHDG